MNETKNLNLTIQEVNYILNFNKKIIKGELNDEVKNLGIAFYCEYLAAVHCECGIKL